MLKINNKIMEVINYIVDNGKITKSERPFSGLYFYMIIWYLRDKGIIYNNGYNENRQKIWVLTKKGERVVEILKELEKLT